MQKIVFGTCLVAALLSAPRGFAVDPLPPELESASLEKQAAYWQRTSRESGEQRAKVAKQRYEVALVYKRALLNSAEERLQRVEAQIEVQSQPVDSGASGSGSEGSSLGLYVLLAGVLGSGVYLIHRQMREAEQPV